MTLSVLKVFGEGLDRSRRHLWLQMGVSVCVYGGGVRRLPDGLWGKLDVDVSVFRCFRDGYRFDFAGRLLAMGMYMIFFFIRASKV